MSELPTSYNQSESWTRYRHLLRTRMKIDVSGEPQESFFSWRGHEVHLDSWPAKGKQKATVIAVHGGGGHGRLLAPILSELARQGYRGLAPDLPAYGLTRTKPGWKPDFAEWPALIRDLADAQAGPVFLFGLSMGGLTAFWAAQMCENVDAVAATTLLDLGDPDNVKRAVRWPWLGTATLLSFRLAPLTDRLRLPLALVTPLRCMTSDPMLADYFEQDPLLGGRRVPTRFFRTAHQYQPPREDLALHCPFALIHPGADTWTPTALSKSVYEKIETDKRFIELTNGAHAPFETPAFRELREGLLSFWDEI